MSLAEEHRERRRREIQTARATFQALFSTERKWYVRVINYSITHSFLNLAIDEYPMRYFPFDYYEISCPGAAFFKGWFYGGPYQLKLTYDDQERKTEIMDMGSESEFLVICGEHIRLEHVDSPQKHAIRRKLIAIDWEDLKREQEK
jgi:hypothetical protein